MYRAFGMGAVLQASRSRVWFPIVSLEFFIDIILLGCIMELVLTRPLTEMSTRNISWGKGGRCVWLMTLPLSCADCLEIWKPQTPGTLGACQACNGIALHFNFLQPTEHTQTVPLKCPNWCKSHAAVGEVTAILQVFSNVVR